MGDINLTISIKFNINGVNNLIKRQIIRLNQKKKSRYNYVLSTGDTL